jgi:hypothetical protein
MCVDLLQVRAMLAVPYFEKALYELPEEQLTTDTLLALADEVEVGGWWGQGLWGTA